MLTAMVADPVEVFWLDPDPFIFLNEVGSGSGGNIKVYNPSKIELLAAFIDQSDKTLLKFPLF